MSIKIDHLEKLYVSQLKDAYSAEQQLVEALPKMIEAASATKLSEAFSEHLQETKDHVKRLEKIFKGLDYAPGGHRCKAMEGLIKEAKEILEESDDPRVRDAAMICAAQKVEHYEIATYGCLRAYAKLMKQDEAAELIEETLQEEKNADGRLSELAEQWVNAFAMQGA